MAKKSVSITPACELLPPAGKAPIQIEKFRSITVNTPLKRLFIKWDMDKTDGAMKEQLVKVVTGGVIPKKSLVQGEDAFPSTEYASYSIL